MKCFAVIALFGFICLLGYVQAEIKSTAILFRHGQRTPAVSLGTLRSELAEDFGYGQLTQTGAWQHYENGLFLRLRYLHLFPQDGFFRSRYIQMMSSIPDRTIMSLQSFMAGIFPPPILDLKLPIVWQPIAFTIDSESKFLHFAPELCPNYAAEHNYFDKNPSADVQAWLDEDKATIDELSAHIGMPMSNLIYLYSVGDIILTNRLLGESVPDWASVAYDKILVKYMERYFQFVHETESMLKVRGGPVITQIVQNIENVINNSPEARNFMIYSAHDMTVDSLSRVLGVKSQVPALPSYADTILIDLIDNGGGDWQIQALYVDNSKVIPNRFVLDVPGCGTQCGFSAFKSAVERYLVADYDAMCGL